VSDFMGQENNKLYFFLHALIVFYEQAMFAAPDTRAGSGAPEMESRLSTLATCGFGV